MTVKYKYAENKILADVKKYIDKTYGEHYGQDEITCFDAWLAMGPNVDTSIKTAIKYLWRYGKKDGKNKKDLLKAIHYVVLAMYEDFYTGDKQDDETSEPILLTEDNEFDGELSKKIIRDKTETVPPYKIPWSEYLYPVTCSATERDRNSIQPKEYGLLSKEVWYNKIP